MIKIKTFLLATLLLTGMFFLLLHRSESHEVTSLLVSMEVST